MRTKYYLLLFVCCFCSMGMKATEGLSKQIKERLAQAQTLPHAEKRLQQIRELAVTFQEPPMNETLARAYWEESCIQQHANAQNEAAYLLCLGFDSKSEADSLRVWVGKLKKLVDEKKVRPDYWLESIGALSRALAYHKEIEQALHVANDGLARAKKYKNDNGYVANASALNCAYMVSNRDTLAIELIEEAYEHFSAQVTIHSKLEALSRLIQSYQDRRKEEAVLLNEMKRLLDNQSAVQRRNLRKYAIDFEVRCMRHFFKLDIPDSIKAHLDIADALLTPYVKQGYRLNVELMRMQYYNRIGDTDRLLVQIEKLFPLVEKDFTSTFVKLGYFKAQILKKRGHNKEAVEALIQLLQKRNSISGAFMQEQLKQAKEVYKIDELEQEKEKISMQVSQRILWISGTLFLLLCCFGIFTIVLIMKERKAEMEIQKLARLADEDRLAKERFQLQVSHSIRTPLNAVVGFADIIANDEDLDEESLQSYNIIIQENVTQLLDYVTSILELSRYESGKIPYQFQTCEVVSFCKKMIDECNSNKQNTLHVVWKTDLQSVTVRIDKARFAKLMQSVLFSKEQPSREVLFVLQISKTDSKMLCFQIENVPLAIRQYDDKFATVSNELNAHLIMASGGRYKVKDAAVEFTLPIV